MESFPAVDDDAGRLDEEPLRVIDPGVEGDDIQEARIKSEVLHVVVADVVGRNLDREFVFVGIMAARKFEDPTEGELKFDEGRRDEAGGGRELGHDGVSVFFNMMLFGIAEFMKKQKREGENF